MKVLSNQNLEKLQGGILCSQINGVIAELLRRGLQDQANALFATYAVFGHGGTYTLQCQPG
jgi:hypothetical protein